MVTVKKEGVLLRKTMLGFEEEAVMNPAVFREDDHIHLFYRAVSQGNFSSIGYCRLNAPMEVEARMDTPLLFPQFEYESHGVEDPRLTKLDDVYYMTYTAYVGSIIRPTLARCSKRSLASSKPAPIVSTAPVRGTRNGIRKEIFISISSPRFLAHETE